ncbi:MAG: RNA polymerase sigma factor [Egibacteraceae bacterium]
MQHPARSSYPYPPQSVITLDDGDDAHAALVLAAAAGDPAAWSALVQRFAGLVWATARAYGLSAAQAALAAEATWLRLAQSLGQMQEPERVGVWLAATARQESLRVLRLNHRGGLVVNGLADEFDAGLWQAFERLPADSRRLLRVAAASPPPTAAQMSAALAMPIADIASARGDGLDRLRQQLQPAALSTPGGHCE